MSFLVSDIQSVARWELVVKIPGPCLKCWSPEGCLREMSAHSGTWPCWDQHPAWEIPAGASARPSTLRQCNSPHTPETQQVLGFQGFRSLSQSKAEIHTLMWDLDIWKNHSLKCTLGFARSYFP